jgi:hypothetical protein
VRERSALEALGVRHRHLCQPDPFDWCIEVVETGVLDAAADLRSDPIRRPTLIYAERAVRPRDRFGDRLEVERTQGPQVDDFGGYAVLGRKAVGHSQRTGRRERMCDEREV